MKDEEPDLTLEAIESAAVDSPERWVRFFQILDGWEESGSDSVVPIHAQMEGESAQNAQNLPNHNDEESTA